MTIVREGRLVNQAVVRLAKTVIYRFFLKKKTFCLVIIEFFLFWLWKGYGLNNSGRGGGGGGAGRMRGGGTFVDTHEILIALFDLFIYNVSHYS